LLSVPLAAETDAAIFSRPGARDQRSWSAGVLGNAADEATGDGMGDNVGRPLAPWSAGVACRASGGTTGGAAVSVAMEAGEIDAASGVDCDVS
jgi:hypothetical protein